MEEGIELVKLLGFDRIVFVIVALCTSDRHSKPDGA